MDQSDIQSCLWLLKHYKSWKTWAWQHCCGGSDSPKLCTRHGNLMLLLNGAWNFGIASRRVVDYLYNPTEKQGRAGEVWIHIKPSPYSREFLRDRKQMCFLLCWLNGRALIWLVFVYWRGGWGWFFVGKEQKVAEVWEEGQQGREPSRGSGYTGMFWLLPNVFLFFFIAHISLGKSRKNCVSNIHQGSVPLLRGSRWGALR